MNKGRYNEAFGSYDSKGGSDKEALKGIDWPLPIDRLRIPY
jgi:hypothetical protein